MTPTSVRLRTYRVGFGDCLLLTVGYPSGERHVLLDLGTKRSDGPSLPQVAALVAEHCGGHLDALVATHRHQDHVGGFGVDAVTSTITGLAPGFVVRPWTDVPSDQAGPLDPRSRRFLAVLEGLHRVAADAGRMGFSSEHAAARALELAELGVKNTSALAALEQWAGDGEAAYVRAGDRLPLTRHLPGVEVVVLGPPTLAEVPRLTSYAKRSEEYWLALAHGDGLAELTTPAPGAAGAALDALAGPRRTGAAGWLLRALDTAPVGQGLDIVEAFDDVLNNTSVVLFVRVGDRTLLLPGDAQAENWSLALDRAYGAGCRARPALRRALAEVDVYKVGHHGSRNATPRRLVDLWSHRRPDDRPLTSVLTTKSGVFGKTTEGAVPKPDLVSALRRLGPVHSTEALPEGVWWFDLEAPAHGPHRFELTTGPVVAPAAV